MIFKLGEPIKIKTIKGTFEGEINYFDSEVITLFNEEEGEVEIKIKDIINEDKKEKTFREVIAGIKEGEVWESKYIKIWINDVGITIKGMSSCCSVSDGIKFKLEREEYTFEEAFKAYEEGKEIQSAATGVKCQRRRLPCENEIKDYCYYNDDLKEICKLNEFTINEIRNKWYINE